MAKEPEFTTVQKAKSRSRLNLADSASRLDMIDSFNSTLRGISPEESKDIPFETLYSEFNPMSN